MPALAELELAWVAAREDPSFGEELDALLRDYVGRPSPLYLARRLSEVAGHPIYLKREDLNHTGAHKINNALGQALLATADGQAADHRRDRRRPARGRHRHRLRAARPRVHRLHGHRGHAPPEAQRRADGAARGARGAGRGGARTLKEAVSAAIRDWVTNVETTHYIIGSCVGPAPYPALVRDLQRVIGDEARAQILEAGGAAARARDRLRRRRLELDRHLHPVRRRRGRCALIGVEAAGEGIETGRHGAPLTAAGLRRGAARRLLGDHAGRGRPDPRGALDLGRPRLPRHRPEHAWLRDSGRARYVAITDAQALDAFARTARLEGIIPALESSHALAWALANPRLRARPDLPVGPRRQGSGRGAGAAGLRDREAR